MTKTVDLKTFLEENRLGEYFDRLQAEGYEIQDLLESGDESLLELMGGKKAHLERLKRGLANLSANDSPIGSSHKLLELAGELPMVLAVPALEFCDQNLTPVLRLWALCDFVELSARLAVIVGIAEHGGKPPEKLRAALSEKIERPTLGQWLHMARAVAENLPENPAFTGLGEFISHLDKELCPLDKSRDFKRSVLALRNRLAHGGGLNQKAARDILSAWEACSERLAEIFSPWGRFKMLSCSPDGSARLLQGVEPKIWIGKSLHLKPETICAVIDDRELNLWPFITDSCIDEKIFSGIYSRRGEVRLEFTPFEGDRAILETEVPESFLDLLRLDKSGRQQHFKIAGFESDLRQDSAEMVGRFVEISRAVREVQSQTGSIVWITGLAGIGKSFLMARLFTELTELANASRHIFAYRFRAGDSRRCSRDAFALFLDERLRASSLIAEGFEPHADADPVSRLKNAFEGLLPDLQITILLDGLDEIVRSDPDFLDKFINPHPSVCWVCAGRPEPVIIQVMRERGAIELFPEGIPPMNEDDIRGMILNKIGPLRKKLIQQDQENEGQVLNPFVSLVTKRANGLPLYVKYVIGDVLNGVYRVLDIEEDLPKNLHAYHEKLLKRLAVGDLTGLLTPLVACLAVAGEPLTTTEVEAVLRYGKVPVKGDGGQSLVERGLSALASMVRSIRKLDGSTAYTLYHESLREHIYNSNEISGFIQQFKNNFVELILIENWPVELLPYLAGNGSGHLRSAIAATVLALDSTPEGSDARLALLVQMEPEVSQKAKVISAGLLRDLIASSHFSSGEVTSISKVLAAQGQTAFEESSIILLSAIAKSNATDANKKNCVNEWWSVAQNIFPSFETRHSIVIDLLSSNFKLFDSDCASWLLGQSRNENELTELVQALIKKNECLEACKLSIKFLSNTLSGNAQIISQALCDSNRFDLCQDYIQSLKEPDTIQRCWLCYIDVAHKNNDKRQLDFGFENFSRLLEQKIVDSGTFYYIAEAARLAHLSGDDASAGEFADSAFCALVPREDPRRRKNCRAILLAISEIGRKTPRDNAFVMGIAARVIQEHKDNPSETLLLDTLERCGLTDSIQEMAQKALDQFFVFPDDRCECERTFPFAKSMPRIMPKEDVDKWLKLSLNLAFKVAKAPKSTNSEDDDWIEDEKGNMVFTPSTRGDSQARTFDDAKFLCGLAEVFYDASHYGCARQIVRLLARMIDYNDSEFYRAHFYSGLLHARMQLSSFCKDMLERCDSKESEEPSSQLQSDFETTPTEKSPSNNCLDELIITDNPLHAILKWQNASMRQKVIPDPKWIEWIESAQQVINCIHDALTGSPKPNFTKTLEACAEVLKLAAGKISDREQFEINILFNLALRLGKQKNQKQVIFELGEFCPLYFHHSRVHYLAIWLADLLNNKECIYESHPAKSIEDFADRIVVNGILLDSDFWPSESPRQMDFLKRAQIEFENVISANISLETTDQNEVAPVIRHWLIRCLINALHLLPDSNQIVKSLATSYSKICLRIDCNEDRIINEANIIKALADDNFESIESIIGNDQKLAQLAFSWSFYMKKPPRKLIRKLLSYPDIRAASDNRLLLLDMLKNEGLFVYGFHWNG